jgi:hypothetical protein
MYLMSNYPSPLLGAPGSSSAVKATVDCMVRYRLLGPLEVESEAGRVDIGPPKRRAVLGALLLARGRVVSADRLVEAVWGDDAPERSTASLQVHVSTLRKTLQDQPGATAGIVRQAPGYYLDLDAEQIDLTLRGRLPFLQIRHHGRALARRSRRVGIRTRAVARAAA